jgi:hypothetical protein
VFLADVSMREKRSRAPSLSGLMETTHVVEPVSARHAPLSLTDMVLME